MRQSNDMLGFGSGHIQTKHIVSKGSVLTTLASIAAFGLSGCTGFIADQIVKPQNSRVADMFTGYRETLLTAGIEPVDFETSVGTISAYQWQARPIELATQASISENDDGSFQGSFVLKFNWDPNEPPDVESLGTIVLLHGHAMSKEPMMTWASLFVDAGFDAVVPDLPGHGASVERPVTFGAVESLAIGELVEQLKGQGAQQPIILFGVSLGASTAVLAAADSEAISAVIGISPYDDPRVVIPRFRRWAPWWAKLFVSERRLLNAVETADDRAGFDYADTIISEHIDESFNIPTLLLASGDDQLVPASQTRKAAERSDVISFIEVANAGDHVLFSGDLGARCREVMPWLGYTLSLELLRNPCRQLQTFQNIMEAHGPAKGAN